MSLLGKAMEYLGMLGPMILALPVALSIFKETKTGGKMATMGTTRELSENEVLSHQRMILNQVAQQNQAVRNRDLVMNMSLEALGSVGSGLAQSQMGRIWSNTMTTPASNMAVFFSNHGESEPTGFQDIKEEILVKHMETKFDKVDGEELRKRVISHL